MGQKWQFPLRDESEVLVQENSEQVWDLVEESDAETSKMKRGML